MELNSSEIESFLMEHKNVTSFSKSLKNLKKNEKAINRGLVLLNKDNELNDIFLEQSSFHFTELSNIIFIVNGGLTTGADNVTIMELFLSLGFSKIQEIIMVPGKQYSFAILSDSCEAKNAVEAISGIKCLPGSKHPLYMACINKAPTLRNPLTYGKPPGLILVEDFISDEEEKLLVNLINWEESSHLQGSTLKHRQVRHFGYEFKYSSNAIDKTPLEQKIPQQIMNICQRIFDRKLMSEIPDQLTVNRYLPGQGIPSHVDTHSSFMNEIVSLSLLGGINMEFRIEEPLQNISQSHNEEEDSGALHYLVYLPPKSLCVMTGPSRFLWTHGICPRKTDIVLSQEKPKRLLLKPRTERISFTFRKVRNGNCNCPFPSKCDSQLSLETEDISKAHLPVTAQSPSELEKEHVQDVYEKIAHHFSDTRHKPWPNVLEFVHSLPLGTLMLDIGCGNGKYLGHNEAIFQLGCDTSAKLLDICSTKKFEVALMNCLSLPFRECSFDAVISIAVIHHLASEERRRKAISEIIRVLKNEGVCLVYVWAMEQRKGKMSTYLKQKRSNRKIGNANYYLESKEEKENVFELCSNEERDFSSDAKKNISQDSVTALKGNPHESNESCKIDTLLVHENRSDFKEQDLFVPWKTKTKKSQPQFSEKDSQIPSNQSESVYHRFYHVFKEKELEDLLLTFSTVHIINSYYDEGNWCVLFKKKKL